MLRYAYGHPEAPNTDDFPVFAAEEGKGRDPAQHLTFDAVAVAYRRALRAHGLA